MNGKKPNFWISDKDISKNLLIDKILSELVNDLIVLFSPNSIILDGSFASGEGSILKEGDKFKILSDFDVVFVKTSRPSRNTIIKLEEKYSEKYSAKFSIYHNYPEKYLKTSKTIASQRVDYPFISTTSRKHASVVLSGHNYIDEMPDYKLEDILPEEGIRIINSRLGECLNFVNLKNLFNSKKDSSDLNFWLVKIIIACLEAILVSNKAYHFSYNIKLKNINKLFKDTNSEIPLHLKERYSLFEKAIDCKLQGVPYPSDSRILWFEASTLVDYTLKYLLEKEYGIKFIDYLKYKDYYLSNNQISHRIYKGPTSNNIIQNIYFGRRLFLKGYKPKIFSVGKTRKSFAHLVYSILPLIYLSLSEKHKSFIYMNSVWDTLSFFGIDRDYKDNFLLDWENAVRHTYNLWNIIRI